MRSTRKRVLTIYPNCSLGGMATVYRSRAIAEPSVDFDFLFLRNFGGVTLFNALKNVTATIINQENISKYLENLLRSTQYDEVRITTLHELVSSSVNCKLIYEIHSSDFAAIGNELSQLDFSSLAEIWVPSQYSFNLVLPFIPKKWLTLLKIVPNVVDTTIFCPTGRVLELPNLTQKIRPLIWIGRFDRTKNFRDFLTLISKLPEEYVGFMVASLENNVDRLAHVLYQVESMRVEARIKFFFNIAQTDMARLYRFAVSRRGFFCSTSLSESFGYGVLEAALTGLPVVAYDVGALSEHSKHEFGIQFIFPGDFSKLSQVILQSDWTSEYQKNIQGRAAYCLATSAS